MGKMMRKFKKEKGEDYRDNEHCQRKVKVYCEICGKTFPFRKFKTHLCKPKE